MSAELTGGSVWWHFRRWRLDGVWHQTAECMVEVAMVGLTLHRLAPP